MKKTLSAQYTSYLTTLFVIEQDKKYTVEPVLSRIEYDIHSLGPPTDIIHARMVPPSLISVFKTICLTPDPNMTLSPAALWGVLAGRAPEIPDAFEHARILIKGSALSAF